MARLIGEIANLLWLFCLDNQQMAHWQSLKTKEERWPYRPAAVRRKIQTHKQPVLVEETDYRLLSECAIH